MWNIITCFIYIYFNILLLKINLFCYYFLIEFQIFNTCNLFLIKHLKHLDNKFKFPHNKK